MGVLRAMANGQGSMMLKDIAAMADMPASKMYRYLVSMIRAGLVKQNAFAPLAIADRGYVLETGTVTLTGTGQELIKNEQVRTAYLGM